MATKTSAKKKTGKKTGKRTAAAIKVPSCAQKCINAYVVCLRRGGLRAKCFKELIACLDDCLPGWTWRLTLTASWRRRLLF